MHLEENRQVNIDKHMDLIPYLLYFLPVDFFFYQNHPSILFVHALLPFQGEKC